MLAQLCRLACWRALRRIRRRVSGSSSSHTAAALVAALAGLLPGWRLGSTGEQGLDPSWVEATAFAWLARQTVLGLPGNLPAVTGAAGPRVLGGYYPAGAGVMLP